MSPFLTQEGRPRISTIDSPLPVQRQHRSYPRFDEHFMSLIKPVRNRLTEIHVWEWSTMMFESGASWCLRVEHHDLEFGSEGILLNEPHYPVSVFTYRRRRLHKWTTLRQSNGASEHVNRACRYAAKLSIWKTPLTFWRRNYFFFNFSTFCI